MIRREAAYFFGALRVFTRLPVPQPAPAAPALATEAISTPDRNAA